MLERLWRKTIYLVQLLAVVIFIVFEEIVWEGIAKPLYLRLHTLKLLQRFERLLERTPAPLVLVLFLVLLSGVEIVGILAGALFVSGRFWLGAGLYLLKLPVAAFTFWLFKATKPKLMRYRWFAWLYETTMGLIERLKSWHIYQSLMARVRETKHRLKAAWHRFKAQHFQEGEGVWRRLKRLYRHLKDALRQSDKS